MKIWGLLGLESLHGWGVDTNYLGHVLVILVVLVVDVLVLVYILHFLNFRLPQLILLNIYVYFSLEVLFIEVSPSFAIRALI